MLGRLEVNNQKTGVELLLGLDGNAESPGQITDLNIFSNPFLNLEEMTKAGSESCGASGDFLSWRDATWTLHSKARTIELDSSNDPCGRESKLQVYPYIDHFQSMTIFFVIYHGK